MNFKAAAFTFASGDLVDAAFRNMVDNLDEADKSGDGFVLCASRFQMQVTIRAHWNLLHGNFDLGCEG